MLLLHSLKKSGIKEAQQSSTCREHNKWRLSQATDFVLRDRDPCVPATVWSAVRPPGEERWEECRKVWSGEPLCILAQDRAGNATEGEEDFNPAI